MASTDPIIVTNKYKLATSKRVARVWYHKSTVLSILPINTPMLFSPHHCFSPACVIKYK